MWTKQDDSYWIQKEKDLRKSLVSFEGHGFLIERKKKKRKKNWKGLIRKEVLEALLKARAQLPEGLDIKIYDGWRSWALQKEVSGSCKKKLRVLFPKWTEKEIVERQFQLAPPIRIVPKFDSHRYGGAFDVTLVYKNGKEVNMGTPVGSRAGEIANLLYFHLKEKLTGKEKVYLKNRTILIDAMSKAGFQPYLREFWHWNYEFQVR